MFTKSIIQQNIEQTQLRGSLNEYINDILEHYTISDAVFGVVEGRCQEIVKGYFVPVKEYTTLLECTRDINLSKQAIRITEDKITLGNIFSSLSACNESEKVFNIEYLEDVY